MVISLYNISSRYLGSYNKYSISLELTATNLHYKSLSFLNYFASMIFSPHGPFQVVALWQYAKWLLVNFQLN